MRPASTLGLHPRDNFQSLREGVAFLLPKKWLLNLWLMRLIAVGVTTPKVATSSRPGK